MTGSRRNRVVWALGVLVALGAVGVFVMFGPPGLGHYLGEPEFCGSCHVMEAQFEAWQVSAHRDISCIECHLPPQDQFVRHWFWKGVVGTRDLVEFNANLIPDPIEADDRTRAWLDENCRRCHSKALSEVAVEGLECWDCHRELHHRMQLRAAVVE